MTSQVFRFPTIGSAAQGQALLLAIDDYSLPLKKNLCYYISKPTVRPEPVISPRHDDPSATDCFAAHFYGTVLHEEGRYRMWYYACHLGEEYRTGKFDVGRLRSGPICYAESEDGVHWVRPELGQVEFKGSLRNNAIAVPGSATFGVDVLRDDGDPDPQRRYKMVYQAKVPEHKDVTMPTATSPDGLHWTGRPDVSATIGMEQASCYKHNGLYIVNGQMWPRGEGGRERGREAFTVVSPDFRTWIREFCEAFALPEPADPALCGNEKPYDQVHLGVGAASFGNVAVGVYCLWHNHPNPGDWFGIGTTAGDFGLVVSHDGLHFREPVKGHVFIHRNEFRPVLAPRIKFETILCQGNGILNAGDQTLLYHGRWANTESIEDYHAEIGLATLPRDRWGALGLFPEQSEGSVWSAPVTLPAGGCRVVLNADEARTMRVEVADARFALLPTYSGAQAGIVTAQGGLDCPVTWPAESLAALGGQTVRFRIHIHKDSDAQPRLYAVYLR